MPKKKRLLASLGVTVALAAGGIGLAWLAPGISGAQTSDTTTPPSTTVPAPDNGQAPSHDPANCRHMGDRGGTAPNPGGASASATGFGSRRGGRFIQL